MAQEKTLDPERLVSLHNGSKQTIVLETKDHLAPGQKATVRYIHALSLSYHVDGVTFEELEEEAPLEFGADE